MAHVDDREAWRRLIASLAQWSRAIEGASPGMRVVEREGVAMTICPAVPHRSIVNDVVYWDREALLAGYGEIERAYATAGVEAWTVWVPDGDRETAAWLAERGHLLDGDPEAMILDLDTLDRPSRPDGLTATADPLALLRLNDEVYGTDGAFAKGLGDVSVGDDLYAYGVEEDGVLVSGLFAFDHQDDCGVWLVATSERSRGRGLAAAVTAHALADARERGRTTATLQATDLGRPVYERLGFRSIGEIEMWERRGG